MAAIDRRNSYAQFMDRLRASDDDYDAFDDVIKEAGGCFEDEEQVSPTHSNTKTSFSIYDYDSPSRGSSASAYSSPRPTRPAAVGDGYETGSDTESDSGSDSVSEAETDTMLDEVDAVAIFKEQDYNPRRERSPEITNPTAPVDVDVDDAPVFIPPPANAKSIGRVLLAPPSPTYPQRPSPAPFARRTTMTNNSKGKSRVILATESDAEDDNDNDSTGDASDDEYIPSPKLGPTNKRIRRPSSPIPRLPPTAYRACSDPPAGSTTTATASSGRPAKSAKNTNGGRARAAPVSRNIQIEITASTRARLEKAHADPASVGFRCPLGGCSWKQANQRAPDFKRHLKSHLRDADDAAGKGWCCAGVLRSEAWRWGVDVRAAGVYVHAGEERVGGCLKTFSRADALKRHVVNGSGGTHCLHESFSARSADEDD